MDNSTVAINFKALLAIGIGSILFFALLRWHRSFASPHILFSDLSSFGQHRKGLARWEQWPRHLLYGSLIAFSLAFIDPHFFIEKRQTGPDQTHQPVKGIAIYIILDQSGSMKEKVPAAEGRRMITKIDLLKEVTRKFIAGDSALNLNGRPNDLIGLVFFARAAKVMAPLTLDHQAILQALNQFDAVKNRDDDGTSIGYAIYKTANLIAATRHYAQELIKKGDPAYEIKSSIMILITDGLQDPNPLDKSKRLRNIDIPEAAAFAKEQAIHLYVVNVEPKLSTEEFAPYRHIMQRATALTGGKFYAVDATTNLEQIYHDIDQLEKSILPEESLQKDKRPDLFHRVSLSPYLIAIGLCCLFASALLSSTLLRKVP